MQEGQEDKNEEHNIYNCRINSNLEEDEKVTYEEETKALSGLKNSKSAGGIKSKMLKHMGQKETRRLHELTVYVRKKKNLPNDCTFAALVPQ